VNLLSLLGLFVMVSLGAGHGLAAGHGGLPKGPPPVAAPPPLVGAGLPATFWANHPGSLGSDGMPTAKGMSAYWKTGFSEQRSKVTLYEPSGVGVSLPNDSYSLVSATNTPPKVPQVVQLERVVSSIADPLSGVSTGFSVVDGLIDVNTQAMQKTILGDTVWIVNVHVHPKKAKTTVSTVSGMSDYASMALANGSDFYRLVIVERSLPSGDEVGAGVFFSPKALPRSMVNLVNSLPG
jgi:hypothetical protein